MPLPFLDSNKAGYDNDDNDDNDGGSDGVREGGSKSDPFKCLWHVLCILIGYE